MKNVLISPSILNIDLSKTAEECVSLCESGADWIHCDIMDGDFVPNTSFGAEVVAQVADAVKLPLDVHLMVQNPLDWVADYAKLGADTITFHVEAQSDIQKTAELIHKLGCKVGMSVKPNTPVEALVPYAKLFDMVLIMSVEPGFGGQKFLPEAVEKIRKAKALFPDALVEVDGGINGETAKLCVDAGVDVLVAGSYIIKASNRRDVILQLKNLQ